MASPESSAPRIKIETIEPLPAPNADYVERTLDYIRRKVARLMLVPVAANDDVPRGTVPEVPEPVQPHKHGSGIDWSRDEIAILRRYRAAGVKVPAIMGRLPGRTEKAIRLKLSRLGIAIQARRGGKRRLKRRAGHV